MPTYSQEQEQRNNQKRPNKETQPNQAEPLRLAFFLVLFSGVALIPGVSGHLLLFLIFF